MSNLGQTDKLSMPDSPFVDVKESENFDDLNESLQDLIIKYQMSEQQRNGKGIEGDADNDDEYENDGDSVAHVDDDDADNDDINLQRLLKQIGVSLHKKYREKVNVDSSSTKLTSMIQQLYKTLKVTQPQLFTKQVSTSKTRTHGLSSSTDSSVNDEPLEQDDIDEQQEESVPLSPSMEHANTIYHQAMKMINVTINRQYDS
jgi:hypothetical protein